MMVVFCSLLNNMKPTRKRLSPREWKTDCLLAGHHLVALNAKWLAQKQCAFVGTGRLAQ